MDLAVELLLKKMAKTEDPSVKIKEKKHTIPTQRWKGSIAGLIDGWMDR